MLGIREYNTKIKSLKNTAKMTKTMKMVSASKFHRRYQKYLKAVEYGRELESLVAQWCAFCERPETPLMTERISARRALLVVFTSDKGLCAAFNSNVIKKAVEWLKAEEAAYPDTDVSCCGKRGWWHLRKTENIRTYYEDVVEHFDVARAAALAQEWKELFLTREYDAVYLIYNTFVSPLSQRPILERFLPIGSFSGMSQKDFPVREFFLEPSVPELLDALLERYLEFKIYRILLENSVGEYGARMTAMDSASRNALEFIDEYVLLRNLARQSAITKELLEIISGAEALKG